MAYARDPEFQNIVRQTTAGKKCGLELTKEELEGYYK